MGLVVPLLSLSSVVTDPNYSFTQSVLPWLLVSTAGIGVFYVGFLWNPHPVTPTEARQLADEHNAELRKKLGLPPLQASLDIGGDRLGLRLSGSF